MCLPCASSSSSALYRDCVVSSAVLLRNDPESSTTTGAEAGLCPNISSSSLKNLHDFLPLPV